MKSQTILRLFSIAIISFSIDANAQNPNLLPPKPVLPLPSTTQLQWHEMEMNAFIHFTTNTFTDKEWGYGDEDPNIFNPTAVNTNQWAAALKAAGFKTMILTCKHHDGFCLWPSKYSDHTIKNSSYKEGKADIVKDASASAKKYGLKFGVYLSPWDRNRADYGQPTYIEYYRNQLKELFTNYGPVFEMWFDGANGGDGYYGGAKEKRSIDGRNYYNWPTTLKGVRDMQPNVLFFSDAGPGVRWVGNERGLAGTTNWNTISTDTLFAGKAGIEEILNTGSPDGQQWVPAEVDVSIRPGWFYHASEDSLVKTPQQLFNIYLSSVGRGSTLLLNIPPDRRGLFHENDLKSLEGFKKLLVDEFKTNLAKNAIITASNTRGKSKNFSAANLIDVSKQTYWATDDAVVNPSIGFKLKKKSLIKYIVLQEFIQLGQRVKSFKVEALKDGEWSTIAEATTIGHKRILKIEAIETNELRLTILDAKACPAISNIELY